MTPERIILIIIGACGGFFILAGLLYKMLARKVGDCDIEWADGYLKVEPPEFTDDKKVLFNFALPVKSTGKQQCILVDMIGRIHPEGEKYTSIDNRVLVWPGGAKRRDSYWEAHLIKPGDTLVVKGEMELSSDDSPIREILANMKYVELDLLYKKYCRNRMKYHRKVIKIDFTEIPELPPIPDESEQWVTVDRGQDALPIRTPLLKPGDTIYSVFEKYVKKHLKEGDVLAVCESALAIMEGRAYYVEDVEPGFLATHINKLFKMDSSLSSPYSLEMAIREVGAPKIILSVIIGGLGRLIGRAGDFYAFAGRAVATIDDCTGTLPPFDKYIVMGPKNPKKSAKEFKKKTGVDLAVVDVNDLEKVDVLAMSDPSTKDRIVKALKSNPQGNANEQTPIALIRKTDSEEKGS